MNRNHESTYWNEKNLPKSYMVKFFTSLFDEADKFEDSYLWVEYMRVWLKSLIKSNKNKLVKVLWNDFSWLWGWDLDSLDNLFQNIRFIVEEAKKSNSTLILGFSLLGGNQQFASVAKYIKELKIYYPNIIFVCGWPNLSRIGDKDYIKRLFWHWVDILNVWSWNNFMEFLANLSEEDSFSFDQNWFLTSSKSLPSNMILSSSENDLDVDPDKVFWVVSSFKKEEKIIHFFIRSGCINNCGFCNRWWTYWYATKRSDAIKTAHYINSEIAFVRAKHKLEWIFIQNPNPMQNFDAFETMIKNIDFTWIKWISFFGDYIGLGINGRKEKLLSLIRELTSKYKQLSIYITYWVDVMQVENDSDFLQKTYWKRDVTDEELTKSYTTMLSLIDIAEKENMNFFYSLSYISHPFMDLKLYVRKFEELYFLTEKYRVVNGIFASPIYPYPNTVVWEKYKWHYIPVDIAESKTTFSDLGNLSLWAANFANNKYLDLMTFLSWYWRWGSFIYSVFKQLESWTSTNMFGKELIEAEKNWNLLFATFWYYFSQLYLRLQNFYSLWKEKNIDNINRVQYMLDFVKFLIEREVYIYNTNLEYHTQNNAENIKNLILWRNLLEKFLSDIEKWEIKETVAVFMEKFKNNSDILDRLDLELKNYIWESSRKKQIFSVKD